MEIKRFNQLNREEKVNFFLNCQELLIKFHPDSDFILRQNNYQERLTFSRELIANYKGYSCSTGNICILFNRVFIKDPNDPIKIIKEHLYQPPQDNYNAVSVDFVVFRQLPDCLEFCKSQYDDKILYLVFVKNNEIKVYETKKLLEKAANFKVNV